MNGLWVHPSDCLTGFLDSYPFGEQLEGVLQSGYHGRLLTRDPDCPHDPRKILLCLCSILCCLWPGVRNWLTINCFWVSYLGEPEPVPLGQWWAHIHCAGRMPSKQDARHIPGTRSSREASCFKFGVTIPRNNFFHYYFPFLPHQLQAPKSRCFLPCATVLYREAL